MCLRRAKLHTPENPTNLQEMCPVDDINFEWLSALMQQEPVVQPRKRGRPPKPPNLLSESSIQKKFYKEVQIILESVDKLNLMCHDNEWPFKLDVQINSTNTRTGKKKIFRKSEEVEMSEEALREQIERISHVKTK